MLTQEILLSKLHYSPETGEFKWRQFPNSEVLVGKAGAVSSRGYYMVTILGTPYHAGRLAWFYVTGAWPEHQIDHINGNRLDNRWENLREATQRQNNFNRTSKHSNVQWNKSKNRWVVRFVGENKFCKHFTDYEEACKAAEEKRKELHGDFAHSGLASK